MGLATILLVYTYLHSQQCPYVSWDTRILTLATLWWTGQAQRRRCPPHSSFGPLCIATWTRRVASMRSLRYPSLLRGGFILPQACTCQPQPHASLILCLVPTGWRHAGSRRQRTCCWRHRRRQCRCSLKIIGGRRTVRNRCLSDK
jgi:hypothetical protein